MARSDARNIRNISIRGSLFVLAALTVLFAGRDLRASENWMFRRSYFSHDSVVGEVDYPRPESRSAYRPAYRSAGFGVRGVNRLNRSVVRSMNSTDYTMSGESWVQFMGP